MDEVRGIVAEKPALVECLQNERNIALLQIAHTAVDELRATARGALGKVVLLDEDCAIAAAGGVYGDSQTGGSSADHEKIVGLLVCF